MPVRYRRIGESVWLEGTTENISHTGILVRTTQPLETGTAVELIVSLPTPLGQVARVSCQGRVVRVVTEDRLMMAANISEFHFLRGTDPQQE